MNAQNVMCTPTHASRSPGLPSYLVNNLGQGLLNVRNIDLPQVLQNLALLGVHICLGAIPSQFPSLQASVGVLH